MRFNRSDSQTTEKTRETIGSEIQSERKLRSRVIHEFLVKWKDLPIEDATWEGEQVLHHPNLKLLEDKQSWAGRTVMSPSE